MRKFGHGHSLGLGFLLCLAVTSHLLTYTLLVLAVGVVLGRAWGYWGRVLTEARERFVKRAPRPTPRRKAS